MEQLLLHLLGDYILQSDVMAINKKKNTVKGYLYCTLHSILYALPFLIITNYLAVILIAVTHFVIDKTNIISYFLAFRNNVKRHNSIMEVDREGIREVVLDKHYDISNFGFNKDRPFAISIWLNIITDNTVHLIINYIIIVSFNF